MCRWICEYWGPTVYAKIFLQTWVLVVTLPLAVSGLGCIVFLFIEKGCWVSSLAVDFFFLNNRSNFYSSESPRYKAVASFPLPLYLLSSSCFTKNQWKTIELVSKAIFPVGCVLFIWQIFIEPNRILDAVFVPESPEILIRSVWKWLKSTFDL